MPILIYLKNPDVAIGIKTGFPFHEIEGFLEAKTLEAETIAGKNIIIPIDNIAYIQEITDEDVKKHEEEIKRRQEASRIAKPTMVIPNLKKRRN